MKWQFEPDLEFQQNAVAAVCDLFRDQEVLRSEFHVPPTPWDVQGPGWFENDLGVGNRLALTDADILANLQEVQRRHGLWPAPFLASRDFTVEMETGTGKTYVYLRTLFELNRLYGFTKFAIVVPSIAIKEGVNKSLEMMGDHLRSLYADVPFEHFVYDSAQLGRVRHFAASPHMQIMVMTVGAVNKKDINTIYQANEKTGGEKPIDLVCATNPIVIVDEPQSVDGGLQGRGREALARMNPLCTLRYSATHVDKYHMVYRLNALDAYEQKLVKQIEVAAGTVHDDHNTPFVHLVSTRRWKGTCTAQVEIDVATSSGGVRRRAITVQDGDDLEIKTGRELYRDHAIGEIHVGHHRARLELRVPGSYCWLEPGEAYGGVDVQSVQRAMIRKTIREHLDKERRLHPQGIKVLSLFFIDKVAHYRNYDANGHPIPGALACMFEEEYRRLAQDPRYQALFQGVDIQDAAEQAHSGYFSIDKAQRWTDTAERNQVDRDNAGRAYNLIMRDKEKLLSLQEPLKFIFSHSALREGWDNPNVFQICALRDMHTEQARRQTLGRGLRLCVNQEGERQRGFEVNTLTIIARESYEEFAANLQREIEAETGIRFGVVEESQFAGIAFEGGVLGMEQSREIQRYLVQKGYLDAKGKITDNFRNALQHGPYALPEEFEPIRDAITARLRKADIHIEVKDSRKRRVVKPQKAVLNGEAFTSLWERVKHKTTYRVHFDNETLRKECADALREAPPVPRPTLQWQKASMQMAPSGVDVGAVTSDAPTPMEHEARVLPDALTELQNRTQLTRRSLACILIASGRLADFTVNPQKFIETAAEVINRRKQQVLVDGIKYQRTVNDSYYAQELFRQEELVGYIEKMMVSQKSVYDYVVWDAPNEAEFARQMETSSAVKVYAKLPRWFQIPTPLGRYNPDWAVLVENDGGERFYFVAETKGNVFLDQLRRAERAKATCGYAHFEALQGEEASAQYHVVHTLDDLLRHAN